MSPLNLNSITLMKIITIQTEVVQQGIDLSKIMDLVTQRAQQITNADGACIELAEETELVYSAASGIAENHLGLRLKTKDSLSGECIKWKIPLLSNDIEYDDRVNKDACRKIGLKSMVVVPLICKDDVVGVLKVLSKKPNHFNTDSIKILEFMSDLIAAAMFNAIKNEKSALFYKATHDYLTGMANRASFYDHLRQKLSQSLKENSKFAIIALDLDGLKFINDTYGHRAGDAAIKEVALRISRSLHTSDVAARLGGDEFGVITGTMDNRNSINKLIREIDIEITKPFEFEGNNLRLRASIGYALFNEDGLEVEDLIEKADQEMYAEKRRRKGREQKDML